MKQNITLFNGFVHCQYHNKDGSITNRCSSCTIHDKHGEEEGYEDNLKSHCISIHSCESCNSCHEKGKGCTKQHAVSFVQQWAGGIGEAHTHSSQSNG